MKFVQVDSSEDYLIDEVPEDQENRHDMAKSIKKIGIVIKHKVPEANELALQAAEYLRKKKIDVTFASESKEMCSAVMGSTCASKEDLIRHTDLILVLGGDGTFLSVARLMVEKSIPILGVNMGQLGFLTEFKKTECMQGLQSAIEGELEIGERSMLECTYKRGTEIITKAPIVNDVVVSKGEIARIFDVEVNVDGKHVTQIKGDGVILSTPTGSTAYCLAAGGPVIEPTVPAMALTAICPHSVTFRPMILRDTAQVELIPQFKGGKAVLTLDGQTSFNLEIGDLIQVSKFKTHQLKILRSPKRDYFSLLREKLKYGYRD